MNMLPVLCCCDPDNLIGHAPASLEEQGFEVREYTEEGGVTGRAFTSGGHNDDSSPKVDWEKVEGFQSAKKGDKKKDKPKPRPRKWN